MPSVSVIIPCYNVETYLEQCLNSIMNQTLHDIEIICVDDGSTDQTVEILNQLQSTDDRIKIVHQQNKGAGATRNLGLSIATGDYVSFLDADDFSDANMLELSLDQAMRNNADIVVYRIKRYIESTGEYLDCEWSVLEDNLPSTQCFSPKDIKSNFFNTLSGYTWDKLFNTAFIRKNGLLFQEQPVYNDAFFAYTALLKADRIAFLNQPLHYQRKRAAQNSITNRRALFFDCAYSLLSGMKAFLHENDLYSCYEQDFINYCAHLFYIDLQCRRKKSYQRARSYLRSKWFSEFDLFRDYTYFYNQEEYISFYNSVFSPLDQIDKDLLIGKSTLTIPVVYATDLGYLRYTIASMCSILQQPTLNVFYRFVILVPGKDTCDYTTPIENTLNKFSNYSLEIIKIGDEFDDAHIEISHISTPTYYRLLLPQLLPECDKCIYIDGDTIACDDLVNLYAIDLNDNYLGAVEALIYYEESDYHRNRLEIPEKHPFIYFNAGVLLMNLKKMREDHLVPRFLELVNKTFESQDQDILNLVCYGKIQSISPSYNVMTRYHKWEKMRFEEIMGQEAANAYIQATKCPTIIHYADKIKPWNNIAAVHSRYWWETVLSSCWELFASEKTDLLISYMYRQKRKAFYENGKLGYIFSKILGGIQCCKDHGLLYTIKLTLKKLKAKFF